MGHDTKLIEQHTACPLGISGVSWSVVYPQLVYLGTGLVPASGHFWLLVAVCDTSLSFHNNFLFFCHGKFLSFCRSKVLSFFCGSKFLSFFCHSNFLSFCHSNFLSFFHSNYLVVVMTAVRVK